MDHHNLLLWLWSDIIFVSDDIPAKIPQKLNYESEKIQILGENGINSKLKHRKLITRFYKGDLVTRTGVTRRSVLYPGELASTQLISVLSGPLCFLADLPPILPCQSPLVSMVTHYLQTCWTPRAGKSVENWEKGKKSWDSPNFLEGKSCKLEHLVTTMTKMGVDKSRTNTEHISRKFRKHSGTWKIEITLWKIFNKWKEKIK